MLESRPDAIVYPYYDEEPVTESDWHGDVLSYLRESLKLHFSDRSDVYVASNLFILYERGEPRARVSPDVFVCLGEPNIRRKSFKTWEAQATPQVVLEVTSESSRLTDQGDKRARYQLLGVQEYYLFDPWASICPASCAPIDARARNSCRSWSRAGAAARCWALN